MGEVTIYKNRGKYFFSCPTTGERVIYHARDKNPYIRFGGLPLYLDIEQVQRLKHLQRDLQRA